MDRRIGTEKRSTVTGDLQVTLRRGFKLRIVLQDDQLMPKSPLVLVASVSRKERAE